MGYWDPPSRASLLFYLLREGRYLFIYLSTGGGEGGGDGGIYWEGSRTKSNLKLTWGHNEGHNLWPSLYGVKIIKKNQQSRYRKICYKTIRSINSMSMSLFILTVYLFIIEKVRVSLKVHKT